MYIFFSCAYIHLQSRRDVADGATGVHCLCVSAALYYNSIKSAVGYSSYYYFFSHFVFGPSKGPMKVEWRRQCYNMCIIHYNIIYTILFSSVIHINIIIFRYIHITLSEILTVKIDSKPSNHNRSCTRGTLRTTSHSFLIQNHRSHLKKTRQKQHLNQINTSIISQIIYDVLIVRRYFNQVHTVCEQNIVNTG